MLTSAVCWWLRSSLAARLSRRDYASQDVITVDDQQLPAGGDVITAIDDQETQTIEDLIAYLAVNTQVGQQATLTILRNGEVETLEVTLAARSN